MIEIAHLTKHFGRTRAVHDVSFSVNRGEVIGLLGPNGSGKTTIMRVLAGFFPPTAGVARVAGFDAAAQSLALRHKIGYLPESVALYPDMRVRGFLQFCAAVRRLERGRAGRRIEIVMHDCGLHDVEHRLIGTLSKGYRQRVGLAQALLHEPEVLILDEPTVGLDPRQIIEIRSLIGALRGRTTVLLSTHILPEVAMTCERVIIIDRGCIIAEDTAERLARAVEGENRTLIRVSGPLEEVRRAIAAVHGVERVELKSSVDSGRESAHAETSTSGGRLVRWPDEPDRLEAGPTGRTGFQPVAVHWQAPEAWGGVSPQAARPSVDTHEFIAHSTAGEPARRAIAAAIVGNGWGLVEVRPLAMSLEDLFVRLVTRESSDENEKQQTTKPEMKNGKREEGRRGEEH